MTEKKVSAKTIRLDPELWAEMDQWGRMRGLHTRPQLIATLFQMAKNSDVLLVNATNAQPTRNQRATAMVAQCNQHATGMEPATRASDPDQKDLRSDLKSQKGETRLAPLDFCERVISHLNQVAGTGYRHRARKTRSLLADRLAEGYTEPDFIRAIDNQWTAWEGTEWEKYLRPITLFGTKFEDYQGARSDAAARRTVRTDADARRERHRRRERPGYHGGVQQPGLAEALHSQDSGGDDAPPF